MRKLVVLLIGLTTCVAAQAQCNCSENFEFVYTKTKINYAGWRDKTSVEPTEFARFTEQQRQKAKQENQKNYCYKIIHDWLAYFRDHHTRVYATAGMNMEGKSDDEIRNHFSNSEVIRLTETEAIEKLATANGVEGIWQMEGGNYRVAITKNKTAYREYAAIILKADSVYWTPGQIKFELHEISSSKFDALFYMRDHGVRLTTVTLEQNQLQFEGLNAFRKIYPVSESTKSIDSHETISRDTELRRLNASTFYFRLPTFNHLVKNLVDSMLHANHDIITETPHLIIDVRDNGGGSD
ncbi:MAG TPA: hypothetical protein VGK39_00150, partial [Cyclobacteriaceae bacterium]